WPYSPLLLTHSRAPTAPIAAFTALAAADSSVTSGAKSLIWSPWRSDRSCRDSMPRAVANTLLPAARPASTIARPRPRELPVTSHTCAIHPPVYRSQPLGHSIEASQTQDWMHEHTEFGKTLCPAMKTLVDWAMTFPKTCETSRYQPRQARKAF